MKPIKRTSTGLNLKESIANTLSNEIPDKMTISKSRNIENKMEMQSESILNNPKWGKYLKPKFLSRIIRQSKINHLRSLRNFRAKMAKTPDTNFLRQNSAKQTLEGTSEDKRDHAFSLDWKFPNNDFFDLKFVACCATKTESSGSHFNCEKGLGISDTLDNENRLMKICEEEVRRLAKIQFKEIYELRYKINKLEIQGEELKSNSFHSKDFAITKINPISILSNAYEEFNSATVLAVLNQNNIELVNIKNCGVVYLENFEGKYFIRKITPKISHIKSERSSSKIRDQGIEVLQYNIPAKNGDIIILGTAPIFNKLYDHDIEYIVNEHMKNAYDVNEIIMKV